MSAGVFGKGDRFVSSGSNAREAPASATTAATIASHLLSTGVTYGASTRVRFAATAHWQRAVARHRVGNSSAVKTAAATAAHSADSRPARRMPDRTRDSAAEISASR